MNLPVLWHDLLWPLTRLVFSICLGLMVGNLIEALNWTHGVARLASPFIRLGHLSEVTAASFSMAFFSSITSNTMLSEAHDQGRLNRRELMLANLLNSLPTYLLHLPTMFFLAVPLIHGSAFVYVGLMLSAAFLRTALIILWGRMGLEAGTRGSVAASELPAHAAPGWRAAAQKAWERFKKRIRTILLFTLPIYLLIFFLHRYGLFEMAEQAVARHLSFLAWLSPKSLGIVALQLTAEISAGLAAGGALLDAGGLTAREVVLALLAGNVLAAPLQAIRHQLPFYSGIFRPRLAMELILYNQLFRTASIVLVGWLYYMAG